MFGFDFAEPDKACGNVAGRDATRLNTPIGQERWPWWGWGFAAAHVERVLMARFGPDSRCHRTRHFIWVSCIRWTSGIQSLAEVSCLGQKIWPLMPGFGMMCIVDAAGNRVHSCRRRRKLILWN
jgi:hypothetical protein